MKKVLIATLHFYNNFGSVLQAYALRKMVQTIIGGQVDILPYRPELPEYTYFQDDLLQTKYKEKCDKFEKFRKAQLGMERVLGKTYISGEELKEFAEPYDYCIVGSDIVWGREFSALDSAYFLRFASNGSKKFSYAASVLLDEDGNTEDNSIFETFLPALDAVAVRETSAVSSIQRFTDKSVKAVLDPTLLLCKEDYDMILAENDDMKQKPYLLSYFLTHDPAVVNYTNLMAKKLGLRVIHYFADYPGRVFASDAGCFAFAGPEEFLGYVKNAACVFTNSFHGTCFAMIYRKPFYTYTAKRAMLSRVKDMVGRLGMEERFFTDFLDIKKVSMDIDYSRCEELWKIEKDKSVEFLIKALEADINV